MRKLTPVLGAVLLALAASGWVMAQDAVTDDDCGMCHDDIASSWALNPHAVDRDDVPGCQDCHGDGTAHIDEMSAETIFYPRGAAGAEMCLDCHQDTHDAFTAGEVHSRADVHCGSCHTIHTDSLAHPALLVENDPNDLCATCHQRQVRTFSRPFGHQLGRAGLDCVSCHNPHGGSGERSLKHDRAGDVVCVTCHSDKRGPFVFPHVSGPTGDCLTCHQPHGSSNPHALTRSRVDQLCLECHSTLEGSTLGSQPPSFHDLRSPRYRECTVCHVTVHGSNTSPALVK
jgi:DmsE family decaheme c-type cytochrome